MGYGVRYREDIPHQGLSGDGSHPLALNMIVTSDNTYNSKASTPTPITQPALLSFFNSSNSTLPFNATPNGSILGLRRQLPQRASRRNLWSNRVYYCRDIVILVDLQHA